MKPFLALLALSAVLPFDAQACSCLGNPPVPEAVADSTRVFLGTVTAIERHDGLLEHVTFQVSEHFKGAATPTVVVENHANGPMCGYPFREGGSYVVYARGDDGTLHTSSCSRTTVVGRASGDLEVLRAVD